MDEIGLGKTSTTIYACLLDKRRDIEIGFNLVVTPPPRIDHWQEEIERVKIPERYKPKTYVDWMHTNSINYKSHRPRTFVLDDLKMSAIDLLNGYYDFVVVTYGFVRRQHKRFLDFETFIDDAHTYGK